MRGLRITAGLTMAAGLAVGALAQPGVAMSHPEDRLPALVTVDSSDYDVELVLAANTWVGEDVAGFFRRTDDTGSWGDEPDPHGTVQISAWGTTGGTDCVTVTGGPYSFKDAPDHAFDYGLTGQSVHRVEVVMADGKRFIGQTSSEMVGGLRGWMVERPLGVAVRVEGFSTSGELVASIDDISSWFGDFGVASTCKYPPWPGTAS